MLQEIKFQPSGDSQEKVFKAALDLTSKFLLLSDINRKKIYVLQMQEVRIKKKNRREII